MWDVLLSYPPSVLILGMQILILREAKPIMTLPQLSLALWYSNAQRPTFPPDKWFAGLGLVAW
jgi:hypothetical protein